MRGQFECPNKKKRMKGFQRLKILEKVLEKVSEVAAEYKYFAESKIASEQEMKPLQ